MTSVGTHNPLLNSRPSTLTCNICNKIIERKDFNTLHLPSCQAARAASTCKATPPSKTTTTTATKQQQLYIMHYEVFGKVQRVFMRKYTIQTAQKLKISGYVFNTEKGTVKGEACSTKSRLLKLKTWLSTKGSPKSKIDHAEVAELIRVDDDPFNGAFIKKKVIFANGTQWATKPSTRKKK